VHAVVTLTISQLNKKYYYTIDHLKGAITTLKERCIMRYQRRIFTSYQVFRGNW